MHLSLPISAALVPGPGPFACAGRHQCLQEACAHPSLPVQAVTNACKKHGGFYLGSIGGPAAILAQECIKKVRNAHDWVIDGRAPA